MYISSNTVLKPCRKLTITERLDKQVGGELEMKCSDCNSEMRVDKESGYMKQYICEVCGRVETLWTVCVTE